MIKKLLENFSNSKYHVLVVASAFFATHVLSENGWITVVLGTLGMHTAHEVSTMVKDTKTGVTIKND